ncbi:MAG TPA: glycoside hydrolase family 15 protein [Symbiobacteriaceae bacterium]
MTVDLRKHSIEVIRANQSPTGAYIASPSFATYHYSWLRDGAFIAYGMDRAGEHDSALNFHRWVSRTVTAYGHKVDDLIRKDRAGSAIHPQDWLHCRYTLEGEEGAEDWGNFQLDGYGAWLWSLSEHIRMTGAHQLFTEFETAIDLVVRYLTHFWDRPNYDSWEEHGDEVHPSSLACLYGGLQAVNAHRQSPELAGVCEQIKRYVLRDFVHDGRLTKFADGRSVDSNLLWVSVPFDLLEPDHPTMAATVAELERRCVTGGAHRYPEDTYYGGGEWLLLTAWLGWYYAATGNVRRAADLLAWIEQQADENGDMAEQVTEHAFDPAMIAVWEGRWGAVAKPLLWSHAMYLVLRAEVGAPALNR